MTPETIAKQNQLMQRLQAGELLAEADRLWLQNHPIYSARYGKPYIIADMVAVDPGSDVAVTLQCIADDPGHPIVPTITIPFEKNGFVKLAAVATSNQDFHQMKKSTKLSLRMIKGITATLRCRSESGLIMVSYQGWIPDNEPFPIWSESVQCPRFAMKKTTFSDNLVQYECCGADTAADNLEDADTFRRFVFLLNWYSI